MTVRHLAFTARIRQADALDRNVTVVVRRPDVGSAYQTEQDPLLLCRLRAMYGETARCEGDGCPFWNRLESQGAGDGPVCTLEHFGLIGMHRERLSRWFLDLKERDAQRQRPQPMITLRDA